MEWEVDGKVVVISEPHIELVTKSGKRDLCFPGQQQPDSPEEAPLMDQLLQGEIPSYLTETPDITTVKKAELSAEEVKLRQALYGSTEATGGSPQKATKAVPSTPPKKSLPQLSRPGSSLLPGGSPGRLGR